MDAGLAPLTKKYPQLAILKVDIRDWNSAVSKQYGIQSVPYMAVFDQKGQLMGEGDSALPALEKLLAPRR